MLKEELLHYCYMTVTWRLHTVPWQSHGCYIWQVAELKEELAARDLETTGKKDEL